MFSEKAGKSVTFNEEVEVKTVEDIPEVTEIEEVNMFPGFFSNSEGVFTRNEIQPVILTDKKMGYMAVNYDVRT